MLSSSEIREHIEKTPVGRKIIQDFEHAIGEPVFYKKSKYELFLLDKKGNPVNHMPCRTLTELEILMMGATITATNGWEGK